VGELPCDLDFSLGVCLIHHMRHASKNATRQQAHREPVRVVHNDRVIDLQVKR
jgi:hypothetical protein